MFIISCFFFFPFINIYIITVLTDELNQSECISVERFKNEPSEAQQVEISLSTYIRLLSKEFVRHLLTHISNTYEGRIIKCSDLLCFEFYGRNLSLEICKIQTFANIGLDEQLENMNINDDEEQYFHISSSTTWSIENDSNEDNVNYPLSNVGGLSDIYEKVIETIEKSKNQSKYR